MVEKISSLKDRLNGKIIVIGIGNIIKGDDGVGPSLISCLKGKIEADVIDCGTAPENYTATIRRKGPNTIVIVDAVDLKLKPGAIRIVDPNEIKDETFSTHNISLKTFAGFIKTEANATVVIIGVQPERVSFGLPLSDCANRSVGSLVNEFTKLIPKRQEACTA